MKEDEGVLPERMRDECGAEKEPLPLSTADLDSLEKKLRGSGYRMVCRHPDIDGEPIDGPSRGCLIDSGQPEQCEMSQASNPQRVTDKLACDYWRRKAVREPRRLSIAEGLALIAIAGEHSSPRQLAQPIRHDQKDPSHGQ